MFIEIVIISHISKKQQPFNFLIMKGFKIAIEQSTLENNNFRKVLYTSSHSQLVLMSLKPNEEIGEETHPENDQFFRFESGRGKCTIDGNEYTVSEGDAVLIPAGSKHNVKNTDGERELKMYTLYSPAHHKDGIIRKTKADAEAKENQEVFEGITTE
jgi:mannose-6-phosphate isomerase-like protein (cupin superfamily)